jgi:hypothetical protein
MAAKVYVQDPSDHLDYPFDFAPYLTGVNDTIASATVKVGADDVEATPLPFTAADGITITAFTNDTTKCIAWLKDVQLDVKHIVTAHIVTTDGREQDMSIYIVGKQIFAQKG